MTHTGEPGAYIGEERRRAEAVTLHDDTLTIAKWIAGVLSVLVATAIIAGVSLTASIQADLQLLMHQMADIRQWREGVDQRLGSGGFTRTDGEALRDLVKANTDAAKTADAAIVRQMEQLAVIIERLAQRVDGHVASDGHAVALQRTADIMRRVEALEARKR